MGCWVFDLYIYLFIFFRSFIYLSIYQIQFLLGGAFAFFFFLIQFKIILDLSLKVWVLYIRKSVMVEVPYTCMKSRQYWFFFPKKKICEIKSETSVCVCAAFIIKKLCTDFQFRNLRSFIFYEKMLKVTNGLVKQIFCILWMIVRTS
jgi:hypothetical protein